MDDAHHVLVYQVSSVHAFTFTPVGSNEVREQFVDRFGIDNARELVVAANGRPLQASQQYLVVRTNFITLEAQNALLKVTEEPPTSTKLVFILPSDFALLATLRSRCLVAEVTEEVDASIQRIFIAFQKQTYAERLQAIDKAVKQKDVVWQQAIKRGLIQYVGSISDGSETLAQLEYVSRWLLTRGASNKMLLEQVALLV